MPEIQAVDPSTLLAGAERHRVYFSPGNPWPQGHAVKSCYLDGRLFEDDTLEINLHLSTVDYRENDGGELLDEGDGSDWEAKVVWNNYHAFSVDGTLVVASQAHPISLADLGSRVFEVDPLPQAYERFLDDELAFATYVLGHDSVADHRISLGAAAGGSHPLTWTARIALSYSGEDEFDRYFAVATEVKPLQEIFVVGDRSEESILGALEKILAEHSQFEVQRRQKRRYLVRREPADGQDSSQP